MVAFTCVCHGRGTRVLTRRTSFCGPSEFNRLVSWSAEYGPLVPSSITTRVPMSPLAFKDATVLWTWSSCWPTLASMTIPGRRCWRSVAASTSTESPMAVTPWPGGGGAVVAVVPSTEVELVEVDATVWWWAGGRTVWWWAAAARAGTDTSPNKPTRQIAVLTVTPPATAHSAGRSRGGQVQWWAPHPSPEAGQRPVAHGLLDVAPTERGQPDAGRHLQERPPRVGRGLLRRGEDDDRVVPEVDAVGALADPAKGLDGQEPPEAGPGMDDDGDHHGREDGEQHHPAAVQEGVVFPGAPEHGEDPEQRHPPTTSSRRRAPVVTGG